MDCGLNQLLASIRITITLKPTSIHVHYNYHMPPSTQKKKNQKITSSVIFFRCWNTNLPKNQKKKTYAFYLPIIMQICLITRQKTANNVFISKFFNSVLFSNILNKDDCNCLHFLSCFPRSRHLSWIIASFCQLSLIPRSTNILVSSPWPRIKIS